MSDASYLYLEKIHCGFRQGCRDLCVWTVCLPMHWFLYLLNWCEWQMFQFVYLTIEPLLFHNVQLCFIWHALLIFIKHLYFVPKICFHWWYLCLEMTIFWIKYPEVFKGMILYIKTYIHNNIKVYQANFGYQLWKINNHIHLSNACPHFDDKNRKLIKLGLHPYIILWRNVLVRFKLNFMLLTQSAQLFTYLLDYIFILYKLKGKL